MLNTVKHPQRVREGVPAGLETRHSAAERSVQHDDGYLTGVLAPLAKSARPRALAASACRRRMVPDNEATAQRV